MITGHCMICKDRKHASLTVSKARMILQSIMRYMEYVKHRGYKIGDIPQTSKLVDKRNVRDLCHSYQHAMCGSCHEINRIMHETHRIEESISERILELHYILLYIKDRDKETYAHLKGELRRLLTGIYPKAARLITLS